MKVIIPLAGLGTRLRPHTYTKPKPLLNVAGKPILGHMLDRLGGIDIEEMIFIVGYLGEQIEEYVEANYHFAARYLRQEELLGQAHAIYLAKNYVQGPVLILFVDTIFEAELGGLGDVSTDGVIYVKEVDDPSRFGVVLVEDGLITKLVEKPSVPVSNLAIIGLYYIVDSKLLFECIDELMRIGKTIEKEYYLADALQIMIDRGAKFSAIPVEVWEDCGKPETLLATNRYLLKKGGGQEIETRNSIIIPPVHIAQTASITNSIIGPYVSIAQRCVVVGSIIQDSIINEGAHIENVTLTQSLVGSHTWVRGAYNKLDVGDSSQVDLSP